jgi:hypothetical protein
MRVRWLVLAAACLPMAAMAQLQEGANWRGCVTNDECVLVPGVCHDTAVNVAYQAQAIAFYKQQAKSANCPQRFWEAKEKIAECRPKAGDEAHRSSSCDAVVKPVKKK